jgi:hypothetical protein
VQICVNDETFDRSICASGEKRSPASVRLYDGQSPAGTSREAGDAGVGPPRAQARSVVDARSRMRPVPEEVMRRTLTHFLSADRRVTGSVAFTETNDGPVRDKAAPHDALLHSNRPGGEELSALEQRRSATSDPVPEFSQSDGSTCGPASLRMVCATFGRVFAEGRLKRLAGTTTDGTDHAGMIAGAMAAGAIVFAKDRGSLDELSWFLRQGLPVIVGWWSMEPGDRPFNPAWTLRERRRFDCGHYSVVSAVGDDYVEIVDPQDGDDGKRVGHTRKSIPQFLSTWNDTDTPKYQPIKRWYMVMSFRPFDPLPTSEARRG